MHHMLGGVRHLVWDFGYGMEPATRITMARFTLVGSVALTACDLGRRPPPALEATPMADTADTPLDAHAACPGQGSRRRPDTVRTIGCCTA